MEASQAVLLVDDDKGLQRVISEQFAQGDLRLLTASRGWEGFELAIREMPSVLVLDMRLPDMDGLTLMRRLQLRNCRIPVVLVTSYGNEKLEREARAAGAIAYFEKPLDAAALRETVRQLLKANAGIRPGNVIVGASPMLDEALHLAARLARSELTVLVEGESGTGKEVLAQLIHLLSSRAGGPLVVFDPSSVPETLLESALFGHERGAFTGATHRSLGVFEQANGGTLIFDEIGNLQLALQGKLLRVLQERTFTPLGSGARIDLELRVVACTNEDLEKAVARGTFRLDLYHRLKGARIAMPPLRQRLGDVELLAAHFLAWASRRSRKLVPGFTPAALDLLRCYAWPGNVRELRNAVEFAHSMAAGAVSPGDLPPEVRGCNRGDRSRLELLNQEALELLVDDINSRGNLDLKALLGELRGRLEATLLARLLRGRSQAELASIVGLDPATISRKLRILGLGARGLGPLRVSPMGRNER